MRYARFLLPLFLILPLNAAPAHGDDHDGDATEIHVLMGEMYFQVEGQPKGAPLHLKAGERYALVFENVGAMQHEVLLGRGLVKADGVASGYREHLLRNVGVDVKIETVVDGESRDIEIEAFGIEELEFDPATRLALSFELPPQARGRWEIGCFITGHYEAGMKLDIAVE